MSYDANVLQEGKAFAKNPLNNAVDVKQKPTEAVHCFGVTGKVLFAEKDFFNDLAGVHFKIKINCDNAEKAFNRASANKPEAIERINMVLETAGPLDLKYLTITKGSVDFEGFAAMKDGFGLYSGLKKIIEDALNAIGDIMLAIMNFIEHLLDDAPIAKETEATVAATVGAIVGGVAVVVGGGPVILAIGLPILMYSGLKGLCSRLLR